MVHGFTPSLIGNPQKQKHQSYLFVTGNNVNTYRAKIKQVVAAGHEIGNVFQ